MAVFGLVGVAVAVVAAVGAAVGFPPGYNGAQSASAGWLADRPARWAGWRDAATRDLVVFVPAYVAVGVAVLAWAMPTRAWRARSIAALAAAGLADVVETVLFRGTLDRLLAGSAAADLATRTRVTQAATVVKYGSFVLVAGTLGWWCCRPGSLRP